MIDTWRSVTVLLATEDLPHLYVATARRWEELEARDPKAASALLSVMASKGWTDVQVVGGQLLAAASREAAR